MIEPLRMMKTRMKIISASLMTAVISACNASNGANQMLPASVAGPNTSGFSAMRPDATSILALLKKQTVIGSTIDPVNGDRSPHGVAVVPLKEGSLAAGDLLVCNYSNKAGLPSRGSSVEVLKPVAGAKPTRFVETQKNLLGCTSVATDTLDVAGETNPYTWTAATVSHVETAFYSDAKVQKGYTGPTLAKPFDTVFSSSGQTAYATQAVWVSDAATGTISKIAPSGGSSGPVWTVTPIITGLPTNNGTPGKILGPSGLQFRINNNEGNNTLYVVDGMNDTVYGFGYACGGGKAVAPVLNFQKNGVKVSGKTFTGPDSSAACVIYSGAPLASPITSAILFNGDLVIANSTNNTLVEMTAVPGAKVLHTLTVDKGAAGAIGGMVATGKTATTTKLYFDDDNDNNVQVLSP